MTYRLIIAPSAKLQIEELCEWWSTNRGAAPSLRVEFERVSILLTEQPFSGSKNRRYNAVQVRRYPLRKTPYFVYYYVEGEEIHIVAIWSSMRKKEPPLRLV